MDKIEEIWESMPVNRFLDEEGNLLSIRPLTPETFQDFPKLVMDEIGVTLLEVIDSLDTRKPSKEVLSTLKDIIIDSLCL